MGSATTNLTNRSLRFKRRSVIGASQLGMYMLAYLSFVHTVAVSGDYSFGDYSRRSRREQRL